jgi:hypothetical protein
MQDIPAFAPVMTAKFRACTKGPPAKDYKLVPFNIGVQN